MRGRCRLLVQRRWWSPRILQREWIPVVPSWNDCRPAVDHDRVGSLFLSSFQRRPLSCCPSFSWKRLETVLAAAHHYDPVLRRSLSSTAAVRAFSSSGDPPRPPNTTGDRHAHNFQEEEDEDEATTAPIHDTVGSQPSSVLLQSFHKNDKKDCNDSDASTTTTNTTTNSTPTAPLPTLSLWEQFQTPPNIITITRMASTPLLAYWVVSEQHWWAIGGCTLAALSDYLDGYLAKNYGWSTVLGTHLDPLADKAFVNTLGIGLWYTGVLPTPLILLWATKDVMLLSGTAWILYQKHGSVSILTNSVSQEPLTVTPSTIAKINTTLQFATLVVGLLSPVVGVEVIPTAMDMTSSPHLVLLTPPMLVEHLLEGLIWTTGCTTIGTVLWYGTRSGMMMGRR